MTEGQTKLMLDVDEVFITIEYPVEMDEYTALTICREMIQEEQE